jgi:hypothetical protein
MEENVFSIEYLVAKYAEHMFHEQNKSSSHFARQALGYEFEDLEVYIDWTNLQVAQVGITYTDSDTSEKKTPKNNTLFKTFFTNMTKYEQEYTFCSQRVTRQSISLSFKNGIKTTKECSVSLNLPSDLLEIGGGLSKETSVELGKNETKEYEDTWGVDSTIRVKPFTRTEASVNVLELEFDKDFTSEIAIKGGVYVKLYKKTKKGSIYRGFHCSFAEMVELAEEKNWLPPKKTPQERDLFSILKEDDPKFLYPKNSLDHLSAEMRAKIPAGMLKAGLPGDSLSCSHYARMFVYGHMNALIGVEQNVLLDERSLLD